MRSIFKAFPFLVVVLWIMGSSVVVFYMTSSLNSNGSIWDSSEEILVKDGSFEIVLSKPIQYAYTQYETPISKELNNALVDMADYLIEQPSKRLLITGIYSLEEEKLSTTRGVGKLRADNLKGRLISLGADPGNIFTSSELDKGIKKNNQKFKGASFEIIGEDNKKLNTNPLLESSDGKMISYTSLIIPYYASKFDHLDVLNEELDNYIERVLEHPEMELSLAVHGNTYQSQVLLNRVYSYVVSVTEGAGIQVTKKLLADDIVSDSLKQNMKIDIGIKRFQNNLEL